MTETFPVVEIFHSIQGEGVFAGTPATFVRLWGCPTPNCDFCDTTYAWAKPRAESSKELTAREIREQVERPHVVITGGEPFLYYLPDLLNELSSFPVEIETSGKQPSTFPPGKMVHITVSPKRAVNYECHPTFRHRAGALKYVVDEDFDPKVILPWGIPTFLQPCWYAEEERRQAMVKRTLEILEEHPVYRLSLQLHKLLGVR